MKKIFGHRGLPNLYPENTFLSLNKALEICDFVETDVRITKDEELILFHDSTINNQEIENLSLQEISDIKSTDLSDNHLTCLLYTSPSPRDSVGSRMPSSA